MRQRYRGGWKRLTSPGCIAATDPQTIGGYKLGGDGLHAAFLECAVDCADADTTGRRAADGCRHHEDGRRCRVLADECHPGHRWSRLGRTREPTVKGLLQLGHRRVSAAIGFAWGVTVPVGLDM